jgi:hypothetical protein
LRNRRGQVVLWLKGRDPEVGRSFGLCLYRPELADSPAMRHELEVVFGKIKQLAAVLEMQLFDMQDFEAEVTRTFRELGVDIKEYVCSRRVEDLTFKLTDLVSGKKVDVVFGIHPARPKRKRKGERP